MTTRAGGCSSLFRCVSRLVGVLAFLCVLPVYALGLGEMRVQSALGEPFVAEIDILSATAEELSTLEVTLGAQEVFNNSGVDRPPFLALLEFEVVPATPPVIRVTTELPITEPFLQMILRARWEFGMILGEYTALLDPPLYGQQQSGSVSTPIVIDEKDEPVVSPVLEEEVITAAPQPVSSQPQMSGSFDYGPVAPGDNLWGIASLVDTAGLDANIFQVMVALLRENPEAFIDNNINRLKIGEKLRLADNRSVLLISKSDAGRTYAAQIEQWEKSRAATTMMADQPDGAQPQAELIQVEAGPAEEAPAEPTVTDVAKVEPAPEESPMEAVDKAVPAENEDQAADAQPAGKEKYVFKIAPPGSEADEGATSAIADAEVEVEAMRAAIDREIEALREQVAKLESQQSASEAATTTDEEIKSVKAEAEKEINALREQITFLKQAAADQEIMALRGQIAEMKRADEMSADASGASAALSQAQQEIRELRAQVTELTRSDAEKPAPAQQDFSDLSDQVAAPTTAETAAVPSDSSAEIAAIRKAANEQINSMREQMEAMRAEMGKLLENQKQRGEENTQLEKRITELVGMLEGKVESTALATLTTPSPAAAGDDDGSGASPKKVRMVAGSDTEAPPVWKKWLDQLPEDKESRIAIAAGVLLILLVLWLMVRRRRSLLRMEESILMTGGTLDGPVSQLSEIRSKKPRYLSDLSMAGMGRMEAAEVDPLAEAEVYLAYGRTGQAIQVLQEATHRTPERKELHLKLLEVYEQQGDVKSFDDLVSEMNLSEASEDQAAWAKVVELKLKMQGDSPAGSPGPARGAGAATKTPFSSKLADQDWELALDDTDQQEPRAEGERNSGMPHDILTQTSGPVDPALQPFPEPDEDARVGEEVLGTLGRSDQSSSAATQSDALQSDLLPRDPEIMNFNTTDPSELRFELDPDDDDTVMLETGSDEPDSGSGDLSPPDQEAGVVPDQGGNLNEVSIKAELAEAYLNMGDKEEALRILKEIHNIAGPDQKEYIADLMQRANR